MASSNADDGFYWNKQLKTRIARYNQHSRISLREMNLIDKDIPMIINEALINKQCTELDLSSNRFTFEGIRLLANTFDQNLISLKMIDLSSNQLGDESIRYITTALRMYPLLTHLRLGRNSITDIGAQYLAGLLSTNTRLTLIELEYNNITSQGMIVLAQAILCSNLKYFYIGNNRQVNDEGVESLRDMIRKATDLLAISLNDIDFSQKCKEKLGQVAKTKHRLTLYL
ncbi:unnamed protein product [Didymodactylos carnosus]|uniref:Uncharacterized protein n=1 Tax=Didymodactylos carnosus TaxID=1234261 RepID=A0A815IUQ7_9BILA|nr:unnamed protein product [Didymodactylos carnosus]CAF4256849.1 unnamed protein product [Didymodactylos carnosus]